MQNSRILTSDELALLQDITARGVAIAKAAGAVDIHAGLLFAILRDAHRVKGLRLAELLAADDANFGHDVFGINVNWNYVSKDYGRFFEPRFAADEVTA